MNTRETSGRYPDNDDEDGELEDPIDSKDIAEGILSGKYYCGINHCWAEELAKAYLDLVNAEPAAEIVDKLETGPQKRGGITFVIMG